MTLETSGTRVAQDMKKLRVDYDHCSYCGACVAVCPPDSITLYDATLLIDAATCTLCERCIPTCPTGALTLREANHAA